MYESAWMKESDSKPIQKFVHIKLDKNPKNNKIDHLKEKNDIIKTVSSLSPAYTGRRSRKLFIFKYLLTSIKIEGLPNKLLLPVLFWIHGGSFSHGSSSDNDPKYLMDHEWIVVTINYRVEIFGTRDGVVPGTMGLKD